MEFEAHFDFWDTDDKKHHEVDVMCSRVPSVGETVEFKNKIFTVINVNNIVKYHGFDEKLHLHTEVELEV